MFQKKNLSLPYSIIPWWQLSEAREVETIFLLNNGDVVLYDTPHFLEVCTVSSKRKIELSGCWGGKREKNELCICGHEGIANKKWNAFQNNLSFQEESQARGLHCARIFSINVKPFFLISWIQSPFLVVKKWRREVAFGHQKDCAGVLVVFMNKRQRQEL